MTIGRMRRTDKYTRLKYCTVLWQKVVLIKVAVEL